MFLLVLVTCVTLQGQTMCHEFEREQAYSDENACLIAAAMERGRYNSRLSERLDLVRNTLESKIGTMPSESRAELAENLLKGQK